MLLHISHQNQLNIICRCGYRSNCSSKQSFRVFTMDWTKVYDFVNAYEPDAYATAFVEEKMSKQNQQSATLTCTYDMCAYENDENKICKHKHNPTSYVSNDLRWICTSFCCIGESIEGPFFPIRLNYTLVSKLKTYVQLSYHTVLRC